MHNVSSPSVSICTALALLSLGLFSTPAMNAQSATDLNELHNRFANPPDDSRIMMR
jgi:hypothetical protein